MLTEEQQKNNPLHGLKLDVLLNELVEHYGWEILFAATSINCFKNKPDITSSLKFLRKTQWAQEKLESFYLYQFKRMPKPTDSQYELPPRQRLIPEGLEPKPPMVFSVEELNLKKQRKLEKSKDHPRGNTKGRGKGKGSFNREAYKDSSNDRFNDRNNARTYSNQYGTESKSTGSSNSDSDASKSVPTDPWANFNKDNNSNE